MDIPASLRRWFVVDFVADTAIGAPLLVAPQWLLAKLGWPCVDPVAARLVGAALLAIGGQSLLGRDGGVAEYRVLLSLKSLWSAAAIVALVLAIGAGAPQAAWAVLSVFLVFAGVWNYYRLRLRQMAEAKDEDGDENTGEPDRSVDPLR